MSTKYSSNAISGYSSSPPPDDGTVSEANKVKYSTIKSKLSDPIKTLAESINSELATHFDNGPTAITSNTTLGATHYNQIIQVSGASVTLTLTDAATLAAGWYCWIANTDSSNTVTLGRATGADTINGTAANYSIYPGQTLMVFVIAATTGFLTISDVSARATNTFSATNTFAASQKISVATRAYLQIRQSNAAADNGRYDLNVEGEDFGIRLINDAESSSTDTFVVTRTGMTVDNVKVPGLTAGAPTGGYAAGTVNAASGIYDNGSRLAKVLISSTSITTTSFSFTSGISSTFDAYEIEIIGLTQTNDANTLVLQVSEDAGSTWKSGASDYAYALTGNRATVGNSADTSNGATGINLAFNSASWLLGNGAAFAADFTVKFFRPSVAGRNKYFNIQGSYHASTSGHYVSIDGGGSYVGTTNAINGIKFTNGGGNMGGSAYLYGIRKS